MKIAAVRLVTRDAARLSAFYADAFGFALADAGPDTFGEGRAQRLTLGQQSLVLLTPATPGRPYPDAARSADTIFQHVALVVPDMTAAMARLSRVPGWTAISTNGPERLPPSSGGVTAFKFRDVDGHPLELLQFQVGAVPAAWRAADARTCLGYDHSAIAVSHTQASIAFYTRLGFSIASTSLNTGPEQSRLDREPDAVVEVTSLRVAEAPPHLELLCYGARTAHTPTADDDIAATQIVIEMPDVATLDAVCRDAAQDAPPHRITTRDGQCAVRVRDPDGHRLWLVDAIP